MKNRKYELYTLERIDNLKDMLSKKAKQIPYSVAFSFMKRDSLIEKTFLDVFNDVISLGTWLYKMNIKNKHIAIIGENSYEWIITYFAVVNSGNVAVPIDKELPDDEIALLVEKADIEVIFYAKSNKKLLETMDNSKLEFYPLENISEYAVIGKTEIDNGNKTYIDYEIDSEKMCTIMFTSGTYGGSKGVMLSNKNITEDINESCKLFSLSGNTVALLPFHHAFGLVVGVFMVFNYGHTVFINKSLKTIQRDLQIVKPQALFLVPLFVETFSKQIWNSAKKDGKEILLKRIMNISNHLLKIKIDIRKFAFKTIRESFGGNLEYIISGGAPLPKFYVEEFRAFGVEILNGYGTTECSPCVAVNRNYFHRDGSVGVPIPNSKIRIANDGEVMVNGSHIMLGYYKDEQKTKEVLKDGWYATGDLGKLDKDGFLYLTGRKKNLIILGNGENISPEELEEDFLKDNAVREVLVYEQNKMIVAEIFPSEEYLLLNVSEKEDLYEKIRMNVNGKRPVYKQVSKIILRDTEFPKNTSKKIIRYYNKQ